MALVVKIELDRASATYFGGEIIFGKVIILNSTHFPQRLSQDLSLKFYGDGDTHWAEQDMCGRPKIPWYFDFAQKAHREYLHKRIWLSESDGTAALDIFPGQNEFPFQFHIPLSLPSSFQGLYGSIKFYAKVKLHRNWKRVKSCKVPLTITETCDLNSFPSASKSLDLRLKEPLWTCCCFKGESVDVAFRLPTTGFVIGDRLRFVLVVTNNTSVDLRKMKLLLIQECNYYSTPDVGSRKETKTVLKVKGPAIPAQETKLFDGEQCLIPLLPPTSFANAEIIAINYFIKLLINIKGFSGLVKNPFIRKVVPITLGTVPFQQHMTPRPLTAQDLNITQEVLNQRSHQPLTQQRSSADSGLGPSAPPLSLSRSEEDKTERPPTYAEAVQTQQRRRESESTTSEEMPSDFFFALASSSDNADEN